MKLSKKIREKYRYQSPYMTIAKKHGVTYDYVTKIAAGTRTPKKKKGLAVLQDLTKLAQAGK